ncbi:MAG: DUF547 domain-containing protein [Saprospiraceae bacterium]|nr:DUF547 domain-containing protein [Saprospiraceae bacterium]
MPKYCHQKNRNRPGPESDYALWNAFLRKYVSADGRVMYKQIKRDMAVLDGILHEWQKKPVQPSWSKEEKMAFWINVYNAFTIKKVAGNYPIKSIMDLDNGKTWDIVFIDIGHKKYSLNDIENEMLRKPFNDPRIHFALNCAAKSCPPLMASAYTPVQLAAQLEERTRTFLSNSSFNTLETNKAEVSRIFEWYATDFDPLPDFLSRYGPVKLKPGTKVKYKPYNWALNE